MKSLLVALLLACTTPAFAQQKIDGNWLMRGISVYDRVQANQQTGETEFAESMAVLGFVQGMLAVHRQNNFTGMMLYSMAKGDPAALKQLRPAFAMLPLMALPDEVTAAQVLAIEKKFLNDNPQRLHEGAAVLLTDGLRAAYPASPK